ncbi:hypothetical protein BS333_05580 [Vibrio azureus]|uniref:MltA-interacting protein n=1 Tax=Vibrio azureus NBRC 104587 TaxID=1219077 RepID=U3CFM2_9VIBR|nr:MipA/OmpV family protein [Vibrio azureus]AUI85891.1 hypothetical protein BS333_05580 [Vibrio azureus]GAD77093.1 hypothetical protein VAZ01S_061_00030 [Vibrio azureus NBRC 104587]
MHKSLLLVSTLLVSAYSNANSTLSLGVGAVYSPSPYIGMDTQVTPLPSIMYRDEHFSIEGTTASYSFNGQGAPVEFFAKVGFDPRIMRPSDSSDVDIKKLDKRKTSFLGGAGVKFHFRGTPAYVESTIATDISGVHNGHYGEIKAALPLRMGVFGITPSIGYQINSAGLNDHLYGVSREEASRTRFNEYSMDYEGDYFVGLGGYMYLTKNITLMGSLRYLSLEDDLKNSPILSDTDSVTGYLSVNYTFF